MLTISIFSTAFAAEPVLQKKSAGMNIKKQLITEVEDKTLIEPVLGVTAFKCNGVVNGSIL